MQCGLVVFKQGSPGVLRILVRNNWSFANVVAASHDPSELDEADGDVARLREVSNVFGLPLLALWVCPECRRDSKKSQFTAATMSSIPT